MVISKEKFDELHKRMEKLNIKDGDITEKFILGSGKGGQKVNKTSSCVYLKHHPTGIEVKCQKERSREANRFFARRELCERIEKQCFNIETAKEQEKEKVRRQKQRRKRKTQKKLVEDKRQLSEKKELRKSPPSDDKS